MLREDDTLSYSWKHTGAHEGHCRMRVFNTPLGCVVLFSELADNHGPSVTNAAEDVVQAAAARLGIRVDDAIFLEHYGDFSYTAGRGGEESFTRICLSASGSATFQHWPNSLALDLLGVLQD